MLCRKDRTLSHPEGLEFELVQGENKGGIWKCGMARGVSPRYAGGVFPAGAKA